MLDRRQVSKVILATAGTCLFGAPNVFAQGNGDWPEKLMASLQKLESERSGRLGVAVIDTQSGTRAGYRADERFPMCSTFKLLLAGAVVARVDAKQEELGRRIRFGKSDLVTYSPTTEKHVGGEGMTVAELCEAAVTLSDNTAANTLLATLGGPEGLTAYVRKLGDATTRLDRNEPTLNTAEPGDVRDTTTPQAMLADLQRLALGDVLTPASRDVFIGWLVANKTGDTRLRAGLPKSWRIGDKTGTGARGTANDVAIAWPSGRAPILIATYLTGSTADEAGRSATLAGVAKAVAVGVG